MKKVSVKMIEKAAAANRPGDRIVEWNGMEIKVKCHLNLYEMLVFVDKITQIVMPKGGVYMPELLEFAERAATIAMYTGLNLPEDVASLYEVAMYSGLYEVVTGVIDMDRHGMMMRGVMEKIDYLTDSNIGFIQEKLDAAIMGMNGALERIGSMFEGVSASDIRILQDAIGEDGLDVESVVRTYLADDGRSDAKAEDGDVMSHV